VRQAHNTVYIEVKRSGDLISFAECEQGVANSCSPIGDKAQYSVKKLQEQCKIEYREIYYSSAGDALLAVASFVGVGELIGGGILAETTFETAVLAGTAAAGAETASVMKFTDALDPFTQYDQYKVTTDDVLNDKTVIVSDIDASIRALKTVLEKL